MLLLSSVSNSNKQEAYRLLTAYLVYSSILKMEAVRSFETGELSSYTAPYYGDITLQILLLIVCDKGLLDIIM
jgi:hypothetical protein